MIRLQYWLNFELGGLPLFFMSYFYGVTIIVAVAAALALTPLMLRVLIDQRKYGWLGFFFAGIVAPPVIVYSTIANPTWTIVALYISLGLYYTYCVLLKIMIGRWM